MKRNVRLFIGDIIDNIRLAERFAADIDFEAFVSNEEKHYTAVRCMEIAGEAVKNIPEELRMKHPEIPWKALAGMRDLAIYFYMSVDYRIIWKTIKDDYPVLLPLFEKIYDEMKD